MATEQSLSAPEQVRRGDAQTFAAVFDEYHLRILRYLRGLVRDCALAEDLAQDTFVKAYRALCQGSEPRNLNAWLHAIATNTALSALRRRRLIAWLPLHSGPAPPPLEPVAGHEDSAGEGELVIQALGRLPKSDSACLLLRFQQDLSYPELAEALGVSVPAAKMRLSRARSAFREAYLRLSQEASR